MNIKHFLLVVSFCVTIPVVSQNEYLFKSPYSSDSYAQMFKSMKSLSLTVKNQQGISIRDFAKSFANANVDYVGAAQFVLNQFFFDKKSFLKENDPSSGDAVYNVVVDTRNGYVSCDHDADADGLYLCLWNRKNGHKLIVIVVSDPTDPSYAMPFFYDYNPTTAIMTPDNALNKKFHEWFAGKNLIAVVLPQQGKNIEVYVMSDDKSYSLVWNGTSFSLASNPQ